MSYVEINARLKLRYVRDRNSDYDLSLCAGLKEEVEALLDRLCKKSNIGATSDFDVDQAPLVKVEVVE